MRKLLILSIVLGVLGCMVALALGQDTKHAGMKGDQAGIFTPDDLKWMDAPPMIPAGAKLAVLSGDPFKKGLYTIRLQMPDGYHIPAHWHSQTEYVTVISGTFHMGMGDKLDEAAGHEMPAGSYAVMPARMRHYAWTSGETVVQVHAMGPFDIFYVNAADDPRNAGH